MHHIIPAYNTADAKAAEAHAKVMQTGFGKGWARVVARQVFERTLAEAKR